MIQEKTKIKSKKNFADGWDLVPLAADGARHP
jgi:hypothetical protein